MTRTITQTQKIFFAMGTVNTLNVPIRDEQDPTETGAVIQKAADRVQELHRMFSVFDPDSEISCINRNAGVRPVPVSEETYLLIRSGIRYSRLTEGKFDLTSRPLSRLWKTAIREGKFPTKTAVERAGKLVDYRNIRMNPSDRTVMLNQKGMELDLGAIAKGYAADEVRRIFRNASMTDVLVNLGGTVVVMGTRTVGIQNPFRKTGMSFASVSVTDQAVVTAGIYEQCVEKDGRVYHHIVDPDSGLPSDTSLTAVTLIGDSAEEGDALSTAVLMLGMEKGLALLKQRHFEGVFITREGMVYATEGLKLM